jgi:hypothetical protein
MKRGRKLSAAAVVAGALAAVVVAMVDAAAAVVDVGVAAVDAAAVVAGAVVVAEIVETAETAGKQAFQSYKRRLAFSRRRWNPSSNFLSDDRVSVVCSIFCNI